MPLTRDPLERHPSGVAGALLDRPQVRFQVLGLARRRPLNGDEVAAAISCHSFSGYRNRRSAHKGAGQTRLTSTWDSPYGRARSQAAEQVESGIRAGQSRKATRGTCGYGWEAQLPVPAGYLGTPKAEVPRGPEPIVRLPGTSFFTR